MFDTLRKHDDLVKAFHGEKAEVVKRLMRQIEEEKGRTERAQIQVVFGLPQDEARGIAEHCSRIHEEWMRITEGLCRTAK